MQFVLKWKIQLNSFFRWTSNFLQLLPLISKKTNPIYRMLFSLASRSYAIWSTPSCTAESWTCLDKESSLRQQSQEKSPWELVTLQFSYCKSNFDFGQTLLYEFIKWCQTRPLYLFIFARFCGRDSNCRLVRADKSTELCGQMFVCRNFMLSNVWFLYLLLGETIFQILSDPII